MVLTSFLSSVPVGQEFSDTQIGLVLALSICASNLWNFCAVRGRSQAMLVLEPGLMVVAGMLGIFESLHILLIVIAVAMMAFGTSGEVFPPLEQVRATHLNSSHRAIVKINSNILFQATTCR